MAIPGKQLQELIDKGVLDKNLRFQKLLPEYKDMLIKEGIITADFVQKKKRNKYNNKPKTYNGIKYHSTKEADYARTLDLLINVGEVKKWERQLKYDFIVNYVKICSYYLDFKVFYSDGRIEHIDIKGIDKKTGKPVTSTSSFKIKVKLMEAIYNITVLIK